MAVLIKGGRLLTGIDSYRVSVLVEEGKISTIARAIDAAGTEVVDA